MPEVRLIDANAFLENVLPECKYPDALKKAVENQPTIEAEPVRHGHWVLTRDEQYEYCHCSECGYDTGENWAIGSEIPYCSQCGSKNYDGGADNGNG